MMPPALPLLVTPRGGRHGGMSRGRHGGRRTLGNTHPPGLPQQGAVDTVCFPTPLTQRLKKLNCEWGLETRCPSGKGGVQGGGRESDEERVKRSELKNERRDSEEERGSEGNRKREEEEERKDRKEKKQQMSPSPNRVDVGAWQHHDRRGTWAGSRKKPQRPEGHGGHHDPQGARQQQQPDNSAPWSRGEGA